MDAESLFLDTLEWLRRHYGDYRFHLERDLVWIVQEQVRAAIEERSLPLRVFQGYPVSAVRPRRLNVDLAILDAEGSLHLAAEFKYEPDHKRAAPDGDIWPTKVIPSVVFWSGEGSVHKDVQRISELASLGCSDVAYAIFIDEGAFFRPNPPPAEAEWVDWDCGGLRPRQISVLLARRVREASLP
jgi:hypothetical protein